MINIRDTPDLHCLVIGTLAALYLISTLLPVVARWHGEVFPGTFKGAGYTMAAAIGVMPALFQGSFNWPRVNESLMAAMRTTAMGALVLAGAAFLKISLDFIGLPHALAGGNTGIDLICLAIMLLMIFELNCLHDKLPDNLRSGPS